MESITIKPEAVTELGAAIEVKTTSSAAMLKYLVTKWRDISCYLVLRELKNNKSIHGYKILENLNNSYPEYPRGTSTVYYPLSFFEKNGFIKGKWVMEKNKPKKIYNLTTKGEQLVYFYRQLLIDLMGIKKPSEKKKLSEHSNNYTELDKRERIKIRNKMIRSILPFWVLQELKNRAMYGYEFIKSIRNLHGRYFGPSTIYPLLSKFESSGLIKFNEWNFDNKRQKKMYTLTTGGRNVLDSLENFLLTIVDL